MIWVKTHRRDQKARELADRHYSRVKRGSPQFAPPGSCLILVTPEYNALWVTSVQKYATHAWAGAWNCALFRNESSHKASELIREAVAATRAYYGEPPPQGMVTFIDIRKVRPIKVRGRWVYGWTFMRAGFRIAGVTDGGLLALQLLPEDMPDGESPVSNAA